MTLVNVFRGQGAYRYICQRVDRIGGTELEEFPFCLPTNGVEERIMNTIAKTRL